MIRLGAAATNALAGRSSPVAISALPATAVIALASSRTSRAQPSSCSTSRCCTTCNAAACAPIATHTCSCSCSSGATPTSPANSGCSRRPRGVAAGSRDHLCRNAAALSPAAPAPGTLDSAASGAPALCDPSAYQSLSLLILLHECTRRAYGSPLLEVDNLLALPVRVDSLPCCVLLLAGPHVRPPRQQPRPAPQPAAGEAAGAAATTASPSGPGAAPPRSERPRGSASGPHVSATGGRSGACSGSSGGGASEVLRVQHLNRSAAEALDADMAVGDFLLVEVTETEPDLLHTMLGARGEPQKGTTRSLDLTLRSGHAAADASGRCRTIHCPEALLLPLMSPNGTSAGVAMLFERWELLDALGRVALQGRPLVPEVPPGGQPSTDDLTRLQQQVRAQADEVRELKARHGLTNKDPRVVAAVAELQQVKAEAELQGRLLRAFAGEDSVLGRLLGEPAAE